MDHDWTVGSRPVRSLKLTRVSLRDQAVQALRSMIVDGSLHAGARINEAELAATLGISRGPLREAIQRIGAEGLIEFRRNRGAFVRVIAAEDIQNMYEARVVIEVMAARQAARNATSAQLDDLHRYIDDVDALLSADHGAAYPSDSDFHVRILELAANPVLERAGRDLHIQMRIARLRSGSSPARAREAFAEHRTIVDALCTRNEYAAAKTMTSHLASSLARLQQAAEPPPGP